MKDRRKKSDAADYGGACDLYGSGGFPWERTCIHITTGRKTFADPVFDRIDNGIYRICKIDRQGMNWKQYAVSLLTTNAVMIFAGYLILRLQEVCFKSQWDRSHHGTDSCL